MPPKKTNFQSMEDLFKLWDAESIYYKLLKQIETLEKKESDIILRPFHEASLELVKQKGNSITSQDLDNLFKDKVGGKLKDLSEKYNLIREKIEKSFE